MRKLIEGLPNQSAAVAYQAVTGLRGRELPAAIASTIMQRRPRAHGLLQRAAEAVWVRPPAATRLSENRQAYPCTLER